MELPQKIKQPEERMMYGTLVATHLSPTELKINELIEYLESQKEGEEPFIQHGGHLYDKTGNEVCCEACKKPIYINNNRVTLH